MAHELYQGKKIRYLYLRLLPFNHVPFPCPDSLTIVTFNSFQPTSISPKRTLRKQNPYGVHLTVFPFYFGLDEGVSYLPFTGENSSFWNLENVYPPNGLCEAEPEWGSIDSLSIFLCLTKGVWHLQLTGRNLAFWILKMFYPPKGLCEAEPEWAFDSFHFIVSREGCLTPSIYWRKFAFLKSWKCFIREGTLRSRARMGSPWFFPFYCAYKRMFNTFNWHAEIRILKSWKCIIPPKDSAKAEPNGVHVILFHFIVVREECLTLSIYGQKFTILKSWKCFIYWWDGWIDGMGYQKGTLIFFILCTYKQHVFIFINILKNYHQHSHDFQNLMSSLGWGNPFSKVPFVSKYLNIWFQKVFFFSYLLVFWKYINFFPKF